jgi:hypothetical protein
MALVLAVSYSETSGDAVVASAVSVIDRANDSIHIVAECVEERHRALFEIVRCNAIVPGLRIVGNLLAQELHDPGVAQMIDVITSNLKGDTLFSSKVESSHAGVLYSDLAQESPRRRDQRPLREPWKQKPYELQVPASGEGRPNHLRRRAPHELGRTRACRPDYLTVSGLGSDVAHG